MIRTLSFTVSLSFLAFWLDARCRQTCSDWTRYLRPSGHFPPVFSSFVRDNICVVCVVWNSVLFTNKYVTRRKSVFDSAWIFVTKLLVTSSSRFSGHRLTSVDFFQMSDAVYAVVNVSNAVVTCEIKLVHNYFVDNFILRRRPSAVILFQRVETCLKLIQNYFSSEAYCSSWIISHMFDVAEMILK